MMTLSPTKNEYEPTISDVMEVMVARFNRLEGIDGRLGRLENSLERVEGTLEDVQRRVGNLEVSMIDVQETVHSLSRAVDKDAEAIINHENRIQVLETS